MRAFKQGDVCNNQICPKMYTCLRSGEYIRLLSGKLKGQKVRHFRPDVNGKCRHYIKDDEWKK